MAFYFGRGVAFWKPSPESVVEPRDPLAQFPSEPGAPRSHTGEITDLSSETPSDLQEFAADLDRTCTRIEALAERTEAMLHRAEQLALQAASRDASHVGRRPLAIDVRTIRRKVGARLTRLRIAAMPWADAVRGGAQTLRSGARAQAAGVRALGRDLRAVVRKRHAREQPFTLVIRAPSAAVLKRPTVISTSAAVMFATAVFVLVVFAAAPVKGPDVPIVRSPQAAATLPTVFDVIGTLPSVPLTTIRPALVRAAVRPVSSPTPSPRPTTPREFIGTLTVESEPAGATVFINQERVGETPLKLPDLRAGSRVVWVESEGYQRWSAGVLVPADKTTHLNVKLLRDPQK